MALSPSLTSFLSSSSSSSPFFSILIPFVDYSSRLFLIPLFTTLIYSSHSEVQVIILISWSFTLFQSPFPVPSVSSSLLPISLTIYPFPVCSLLFSLPFSSPNPNPPLFPPLPLPLPPSVMNVPARTGLGIKGRRPDERHSTSNGRRSNRLASRGVVALPRAFARSPAAPPASPPSSPHRFMVIVIIIIIIRCT